LRSASRPFGLGGAESVCILARSPNGLSILHDEFSPSAQRTKFQPRGPALVR
jgi:hypothetical protein